MEGARCWRADWILGSKQICSLQWLSLDLGEPKAPKKLSELYVREILYFLFQTKPLTLQTGRKTGSIL